jgi:hypothetical protein
VIGPAEQITLSADFLTVNTLALARHGSRLTALQQAKYVVEYGISEKDKMEDRNAGSVPAVFKLLPTNRSIDASL